MPLVDLGLFRSPGFRWGTILVTLVSFAMFGLLFAMPQYFQDVRGTDALGSGLRLLPLVGGMLVGMVAGTRLQSPRKGLMAAPLAAVAGAKPVVTVGYLVMAAAMAIGAFTTIGSSTGYTLAWVAIAGLGLGFAMPSAMNISLGALSAERSGSGAALISALRQVGATIGVAVLGTVISNGYRSRAVGYTACRRRPPRPCAAASPAGSRSPGSLARRRCLRRCGRRSCTAWTPCCGSAAGSRSRPPCSRSCSCRGARQPKWRRPPRPRTRFRSRG